MKLFFREKLLHKSKNSAYATALSHILLIDSILKKSPDMDYQTFANHYSSYSDEQIEQMQLLSIVHHPNQLKSAISNVKKFFSNSLGQMAAAERGIIGKPGYDEFLDRMEHGLQDWADVLAKCEEFIDSIEVRKSISQIRT